MAVQEIQLNCHKVRSLTGETQNLKEKMFEIETLANDIDIKLKEAIDREVLFGWIYFAQNCKNNIYEKKTCNIIYLRRH